MKKHDVECFENAIFGEKYYKIKHASGLTVFVYPKKLSAAYVMFTTRYGSLERTFRENGEEFVTVPDGVAHFLEHKLFEEEDGGDAFSRFAPFGAYANAFTSFEMTTYLFSATDHIEEALSVLLDFVTHPYFTEENVKKEQGIIAQEIGMRSDDPRCRRYDSFLEGLYRHHNVKVDIAGTVKSISEITPEILYQCYRAFYRLSNMALTVCADIDPDAVMKVVDELLPSEKDDFSVDVSYPTEETQIAYPLRELYMSVATPMFAFGVKDLAVFDDPQAKAKHALLAEMLCRCCFSRSSKFYNELYDSGLIVKDLGYCYESMNSCAYLMLSGESEEPMTVYQKTVDMLKNIAKNPPSLEDFSRIKRVMYANYVRVFDNTESLAMALTDSFINGTELLSIGDLISSIRYEDMLRFASEFFVDKEFSLTVVYPSMEANKEKE